MWNISFKSTELHQRQFIVVKSCHRRDICFKSRLSLVVGCDLAPFFPDSFVVGLKSSPWPKHSHVPLSNLFSTSSICFIRLFLANTWKKIGDIVLVWEERSIYFAIELCWKEFEISYVLCARGLMRALTTRKSCAVGMCNVIPRITSRNRKLFSSFHFSGINYPLALTCSSKTSEKRRKRCHFLDDFRPLHTNS